MYPELEFIPPFLPPKIRDTFPVWTEAVCRRIEKALATGCPLAVVGPDDVWTTALLTIVAGWLEWQGELVHNVDTEVVTLDEFMSGVFVSIQRQLNGEVTVGEEGEDDKPHRKIESPVFKTIDEFIGTIQGLLEENRTHLFIFIGSITAVPLKFSN